MRHFSNGFNIAAIVFLLPTRHRTIVAFEALLIRVLILLRMEHFVGGKTAPEIWEVFVIGLSDTRRCFSFFLDGAYSCCLFLLTRLV